MPTRPGKPISPVSPCNFRIQTIIVTCHNIGEGWNHSMSKAGRHDKGHYVPLPKDRANESPQESPTSPACSTQANPHNTIQNAQNRSKSSAISPKDNTGAISPWHSTCLACRRFRVQSLAFPVRKNSFLLLPGYFFKQETTNWTWSILWLS